MPTILAHNQLTLQSRGGGKGLVDVRGEEGLEVGPCPHVHTGTDVEVGVHKEGEATEKAPTGTGGGGGGGGGEEREREELTRYTCSITLASNITVCKRL